MIVISRFRLRLRFLPRPSPLFVSSAGHFDLHVGGGAAQSRRRSDEIQRAAQKAWRTCIVNTDTSTQTLHTEIWTCTLFSFVTDSACSVSVVGRKPPIGSGSGFCCKSCWGWSLQWFLMFYPLSTKNPYVHDWFSFSSISSWFAVKAYPPTFSFINWH